MRFCSSLMTGIALISNLVGLSVDHDQSYSMHLQLEMIKSAFELRYAPISWKHSYCGWTLESAMQEAKEKTFSSKKSVKDFQRILREFFYSCADYHADVFYYSTEEACLPFKVKYIDKKLLVTFIDRTKFPESLYPFQVGDELIFYDHLPAIEWMNRFKAEERQFASELTNNALAVERFTRRQGLLGHTVSKGEIDLKFKSASGKKIYHVVTSWDYKPEKVMAPFLLCDSSSSVYSDSCEAIFNHEMALPRYTVQYSLNPHEEERNELGSYYSEIPFLGKVVWRADKYSLFHAYLFKLPCGKTGGYLRIPHYRGTERHLEQFKSLIDHFQKKADILVIDQLNNPGGSPVYLYTLLSMLTDKPLITPKHRMSLSYHEAASSATMLPVLETIRTDAEAKQVLSSYLRNYPLNLHTAQGLIRYFTSLQEDWNQGKKLSSPYALYGIEEIMPHPEHCFTKPLVVLINCLDFSAGDFLPSILQDNQRAILFGERTAGAGGIFASYSYPNSLGIRSFHLTISIAERVNEVPVENLGVEPDVHYSVSEKDILSHYADYKLHLLQLLENILYGRNPSHS